MNDEDLLNMIQQHINGKRAAVDYVPPLPHTGPMNRGAVQDITPQEYDEGEEPPYPGYDPRTDELPMNKRDMEVSDADRVRTNRLRDPYEDRGIFHYPLDDIRDVMRWGRGDELGDEAFNALDTEGLFKGMADPVMRGLRGMNPEQDDFAFIREMEKRLGLPRPNKLYDDFEQEQKFRQENPGRGGLFSLDRRDPNLAYPRR